MSDFNAKHNRAVWMDIPVADLARASAFYAGVLGIKVQCDSHEGQEFGILEHDQGNGGSLVPDPGAIAAGKGPLVYLNVDGRIREALRKVRELGGAVTQGVHSIGPHGFRALITDSEGNRMALHSSTDA